MARLALYGWKTIALGDAHAQVQSALGLRFDQHACDFHGQPYYRTVLEHDEDVVVRLNGLEDQPLEPAYPEHRVLLYINRGGERPELVAALAAIAGLEKLYEETF